MPKPCALPFGVAPRVALPAFGCFFERDLTVEMANEPRHAMRLHGRKGWIEATRRECTNLVERAFGQHRIEAHIDASIKLLALDLEKDLDGSRCVNRGFHAVAMPVGERAPGRQHDLERAGDAGALALHQAFG